jgi:hypothetical protein
MPERPLSIEQILTMLETGPPRLVTLTDGIAPAQLQAAPGPGEWSANEVLAHLRSCADVWGDCIEVILTQDKPTIRAVNPRTWITKTDYLEQPFQPSLHAFAAQRHRLIKRLKPLAPEAWRRASTITGAGKPFVRTVHSYAQWMATHERPHVKQIERIVNSLRARLHDE